MLGRLLLGLIKGVLVLGAVGSAFVLGLGQASVSFPVAYAAGAAAAVLMALIGGKALWKQGALLEAALRTVLGVAVSFGLMWASMKYIGIPQSLLGKLGGATVEPVSLAYLGFVVVPLALLFELDNTPAPAEPAKVRLATSARDDDDALEEAEARPSALAEKKR